MKNNIIKNAINNINLSDDASRRIYNNIVIKNKKKVFSYKPIYACAMIITFFIIMCETSAFSFKTPSFIKKVFDLSDEYDSNITGQMFEVENEDVKIKIEECFADLTETCLFVSTEYKRIPVSMAMDDLRVNSNSTDLISYMTHNCKIEDNKLYTIINIQYTKLPDDLFLSFERDKSLNLSIDSSILNVKTLSIDPYQIDTNIIIEKLLISKYCVYLYTSSNGSDNALHEMLKEKSIFVTSNFNKKTFTISKVSDAKIFSNYNIIDRDSNTQIYKYPFTDIIDLDSVKSISIEGKTFNFD